MAEEVYMDIPQVQTMAQNFGTYGTVLQQVSKAVSAVIFVLKLTALVGDFLDPAWIAILELFKARIDSIAQKLIEYQGAITSAINNYQTGDVTGSTLFLPGHY